jgi:hypothetical protein
VSGLKFHPVLFFLREKIRAEIAERCNHLAAHSYLNPGSRRPAGCSGQGADWPNANRHANQKLAS